MPQPNKSENDTGTGNHGDSRKSVPSRLSLPENATEIILESISDGVFTVDMDWRITSFNRAAETITGILRQEAIGRHCWEVFRSNMCESDCALKKTLKQRKSFISTDTCIVNSRKKCIPVTVCASLLKDKEGRVIGGVETFRDHSLVEALRRELSGEYRLGDIVSRSPVMKQICALIPQIAESDSTVLIQGETGTGKELTAKAIHHLSPRNHKPFVAINCGALPDTLLESELFGYKAGAFTHAVKDKPGLFALAEGGALFLDEIGDTSPAFQAKLLRVLEEKEFLPLGAIKKQHADVRVIAAANRDLSAMVADKTFRQDLFYRIDVIRIQLPPLRARMEDIPLLADHFIQKLNRLRGKAITGIAPEAMERLMSHDFPGNIRELENIIEHAFVICRDGNIRLRHLPASLTRSRGDIPRGVLESNENPVKSAERGAILASLEKNRWNREAAARELGMHKSTLFRKIKKLGLLLPEIDGRTHFRDTVA